MATERPYPRASITRAENGTWKVNIVKRAGAAAKVKFYKSHALAVRRASEAVLAARGSQPSAKDAAVASKPRGPGRQATVIPSHCPNCGRPVRKAKEKLTDFPGTIPVATKDGTCLACKRAKQKNALPPRALKPRNATSTCITCQRPFRGHNAKASDQPGTVARCTAAGQCVGCYAKDRNEEAKEQRAKRRAAMQPAPPKAKPAAPKSKNKPQALAPAQTPLFLRPPLPAKAAQPGPPRPVREMPPQAPPHKYTPEELEELKHQTNLKNLERFLSHRRTGTRTPS